MSSSIGSVNSAGALRLRPASEYRPAELADLFNLSFRGYIVPVRVAAGFVDSWTRNDSLEIARSRVLLRSDVEIGLALIARRGWTSRLAALAIEPDSRGRGVGRWLLEALLQEARERDDRTVVLECIEQNPAAVAFYRALGFRTERRLAGYTAEAIDPLADPDLIPIDPAEVGAAVGRYADGDDLPWQVSAPTLIQTTAPGIAYRLGPARALLSDPSAGPVYLRTLIVPPEERRRGWATRLVKALAARYPDKLWKVAPIWPEEIAPELFLKLGFVRDPVSQLQMRCDL